ncbi:MAG: TetR/AcrR family transcriptional regulator [Desulfosudaceae bacterium]
MTAIKNTTKGELTRRRILTAARRVFCRQSFAAASLRTIAAEAGVRHPLVVHYFGSKTALFEEVSAAIQKEILEDHPRFFHRLQSLEADERPRFYLDGIIRQGLRQPDAYRLMLLNAVEAGRPDQPMAGLERMIKIHEQVLALISEVVLDQAPRPETAMFLLVLTLVVVHFAGGKAFHQQVLNLPADADYEEWVRDTVAQIFLPALEAIPAGRTPFMDYHLTRWPGLPEEPSPGHSDSSPAAAGRPRSKGELTRRRILEAARQVFAAYPYDRATIRLIGQAGGFDFSRIHHFFPTKADLFEAVLRDNFQTFNETIAGWQIDPEGLATEDIFIHYLQKGLTYCFTHRQTVAMLVLNIAHYERYRDQAGFDLMTRVQSGMLAMVRRDAPPGVPAERVSRWLYTIVMMGYTLAGAPVYPARLLNLDPAFPSYPGRVFEILGYVFMPSLLTRPDAMPGQ